jgi:hypothetical protein
MEDNRVSGVRRQGGAMLHSLFGTVVLFSAAFTFVSYLRHARSLLFFAARSDAFVSPPLTLMRLSESRMPWVGIGARFELSVRELTPIHEISEDSRPYSILGQRFMTT